MNRYRVEQHGTKAARGFVRVSDLPSIMRAGRTFRLACFRISAPGRTRTCDIRLRRPLDCVHNDAVSDIALELVRNPLNRHGPRSPLDLSMIERARWRVSLSPLANPRLTVLPGIRIARWSPIGFTTLVHTASTLICLPPSRRLPWVYRRACILRVMWRSKYQM